MAGDSSPPVAANTRTQGATEGTVGAAPCETAATPGSSPASSGRWVRVLYLFAGARRKSSLAQSLRVACKSFHHKVAIDEVDVLRGGHRHDLLNKKRQNKVISKIKQGHYHFVAASPP